MLIRFIIGGLMYMGMEVLFDNTSDRSMGLAGGLAFILCGSFDEWFNLPFWANCLMIASVIMIIEYIFGKIFNRDFKIWDYRHKKFNFQGQICLPFFIVWLVVIAPIIIWFDNVLRLAL